MRSSSTASRRLALSLYWRRMLSVSSCSTAVTSMLSLRSAVMVDVRCFFAKSSFLMSLQISCTMCSLCAALLLMSWILPLSSTMACLAWSRSAFARAPPVLCDRTAARISSSTFEP